MNSHMFVITYSLESLEQNGRALSNWYSFADDFYQLAKALECFGVSEVCKQRQFETTFGDKRLKAVVCCTID